MEVEQESHLRGQLNPLLIPHILENVMKYTNFEDLKSSRLVCRAWEADLNPVFRDRAVINLETVNDLEKFNSTKEEEILMFGNFRLGPGILIRSEAFSYFCHKFSSTIRSLHFNNCDWTGTVSMFRNVVQELPNLQELQLDLAASFTDVLTAANNVEMDLPNLKSLTVETPVRSKGEWYVVRAGQFFYNLIVHSPYLESIMYSGCKIPCLPKDFLECFSCKVIFEMIVNSESIKLRNLKNFEILRRCTYNELQMMEAKGFPLQNLHLILVEDSEGLTSTSLCSLLVSLRDTLRRLTLVFLNQVDFSHKKFNCFQQLKRLEYLTLEGCHGSTDFVHHLPSFKLLSVVEGSEEREVIPINV